MICSLEVHPSKYNGFIQLLYNLLLLLFPLFITVLMNNSQHRLNVSNVRCLRQSCRYKNDFKRNVRSGSVLRCDNSDSNFHSDSGNNDDDSIYDTYIDSVISNISRCSDYVKNYIVKE